MDLVTNSEICVFCNSLKYKDNSRCRLEAGDPRGNFTHPPGGLRSTRSRPTANGQRSTATVNGLGHRVSGRSLRLLSERPGQRPGLQAGEAACAPHGLGQRPTANGQRSRPRPRSTVSGIGCRASGIGCRDASCGCFRKDQASGLGYKQARPPALHTASVNGQRSRPTATANGHGQRSRPTVTAIDYPWYKPYY